MFGVFMLIRFYSQTLAWFLQLTLTLIEN